MKTYTESELIESFRQQDRKLIPIPKLDNVIWNELAYFGWLDPQGHRGYICAEVSEKLVGVTVDMNKGDSSMSGGVCDLCFSTYPIAATKPILVQSWSNANKKLGIHICRNLDCSDAVTGKRRSNSLTETIDVDRKLERVRDKLERFLLRVMS